jgi:hypothetical protein
VTTRSVNRKQGHNMRAGCPHWSLIATPMVSDNCFAASRLHLIMHYVGTVNGLAGNEDYCHRQWWPVHQTPAQGQFFVYLKERCDRL